MFSNILVCSDGSEGALEAARMGARIAQKFHSVVFLIHPFGGGDWEFAASQEGMDVYAEKTRREMEERTGKILREANLKHKILLEYGHPAEAITRVAQQHEADLIVLGGPSKMSSLLMSSVSEQVLHYAHCPVLIVRGDHLSGDIGEFRHILLASDGSECAQKAASVAVAIAQKFATSLTVLNICAHISSERLPGDDRAPITDGDVDLYAQRLLEQVTQGVGDLAKEKGVSCTYHQEVGHTDEIIVRFAEQQKADLILLGKCGLSGFERMLLGSVSNHVTHHAHCPVLVVR
jgi:nucleotide-binding universal stress UspA family protein